MKTYLLNFVCFTVLMILSTSALAGGVTMEKYNKVEMGMTYREVVKILGPADQELSRSEMAGFTTVMFMWEGTGMGANMNLMLQNGKVVNKAQFGLK